MESFDKLLSLISDAEKRKKTEAILKCLEMPQSIIQKIMATMEEQIALASSTDENTRKKSDLLWEVTYVRKLLEGNENGDYIGIDLGGTNFRIVRVHFTNGVADTTTKYYDLNETLLSGPVEGIMDYIAECLGLFLSEEKLSDRRLPVGFTFSFPSIQKSLKNSILVTWTKSFKCPNGIGEDPCIMLEKAIERKGGLPVDIIARLSDTTATLMAGTYADKKCRVGVILGTGSNASFVEHLENIEKWDGDFEEPKQVIINAEWGCFGDNGCLDFYKTDFEKEVDQHSNHVGSFTFEKSFAGLYLGELVRLILLRLANDGVLFNGKASDKLFQRWNFPTKYVTNIEKDDENNSSNTNSVLTEVGIDSPTSEDISLVKGICSLVSQRAAYIVTAALAVMLKHVDLPEVTIAVDGSLYEHHPKFHGHMMDLLNHLLPNVKAKIILVKDGSGQGAAFVAAVATG